MTRNLVDVIFTVSAIVAGVGTIIGALVAVYRIARRLDDAVGKDSQGRTISDRLERVEHQLWENGGSSLADRVNRIEATSGKTHTETVLIKEILVAMVAAKK
jgi:phytoene/squalene synthetase